MAGVEWGPKNAPPENRKLLEVTRFPGRLLQEIDTRVTSYLKTHPNSTRNEAVADLTAKDKESRRMQAGLDILNQLAVIGRTGNDVCSVVVRQDVNINSYWYEIDWVNWVNQPIEKPAATTQTTPPARSTQPMYPFKTTVQRLTEKARISEAQERRRRERAEKEARARKEEEQGVEREIINGVVIDAVRETTEQVIKAGQLKVELGEDGKAVILYREPGFGEYSEVDRESGIYKGFGNRLRSIELVYFRYFNILAQRAEGQIVDYTPKPHPLDVCQDIYERARQAGLLRVTQDPERGAVFYYSKHTYPLFTLFESEYGEMDLERNMVLAGTTYDPDRVRPIHPDFAEVLRRKKIELDSQ